MNQLPPYPFGEKNFMKCLDQQGKDLYTFPPAGINKAYVQVEFYVAMDGSPLNFKVLKGVMGAEDLEDEMVGEYFPSSLHKIFLSLF